MSAKASIPSVVVGVITLCLVLSTRDWQPMDAARWAWLPGTLFGVVVGTWGGVSGTLAQKGRGRAAVTVCGWLLFAWSVGALAGALVLLTMGKGWHIWYPWLLPGGLGALLLPRLLRTVGSRYQEAETRRLSAKDISSI
jgi:hypothetical protein